VGWLLEGVVGNLLTPLPIAFNIVVLYFSLAGNII
jgi:hypothetical protein